MASADRMLTQSLDGIKKLDPYRAMIASGIAHDHFLKAHTARTGHQAGGLTQILVLIDQKARGNTKKSETPA